LIEDVSEKPLREIPRNKKDEGGIPVKKQDVFLRGQIGRGIFLYICFSGILVVIVIVVASILSMTGNLGNTGTIQSSKSLPQNCIGDCMIGQSATDGYYNHQKITLNQVYYLMQPYIDPDPDPGSEYHNWDWIILDITIENLRPEKPTDFGFGSLDAEYYDANRDNNMITCFDTAMQNLELTTFDFSGIPAGEKRRGNIGCVVNPQAKLPLYFEYGFDNWFYQSQGKGKHATFTIDKFVTIQYADIDKSKEGRLPYGVSVRTT